MSNAIYDFLQVKLAGSMQNLHDFYISLNRKGFSITGIY